MMLHSLLYIFLHLSHKLLKMSDISSSHQTRITFENLIICPPTVIVSEANNEVDDPLCYILGHDPQS